MWNVSETISYLLKGKCMEPSFHKYRSWCGEGDLLIRFIWDANKDRQNRVTRGSQETTVSCDAELN